MAIIYLIEGDEIHARSLNHFLETHGHQVQRFETGSAGIIAVRNKLPDLLILDSVLPDGDGNSVLRQLVKIESHLPIIMITNIGSVKSAIKALKNGALEYLVKPLDYEELHALISRSLVRIRQSMRKGVIEKQRKTRFSVSNIVGNSPAISSAIQIVQKIAASPATTVLIQGESGTGKELFAKAIHYNSSRFQKAFVEINCSAIPEGLLEAELFGHEKGAFTGAGRMKKGLFEIADKGTIFLDEIADMPLVLQAKLVKTIEEKKFRRVGGTKEVYFDTRIIAATHQDLSMAVKMKSFRHDLYYRLCVILLTLPPLRNREKDILLLAEHFLDYFNKEYGFNVDQLSAEVKSALLSFSWPGNVRQLRNTIERAVVLNQTGMIEIEQLQLEESCLSEKQISLLDIDNLVLPDTGFNLDNFNRLLMKKVLDKADGNKTRAAKMLGMTRDTFRYRWKQQQSK
ncbi:sigma-54 dependent transcriptional regulator [bacterium]|nr:sigma-54 dependent transcriptional regulator [bacterium]